MTMQKSLSIVHLRRGKEESLERRHPWIFSGAIERISEGIAPLMEEMLSMWLLSRVILLPVVTIR